MIALHGKGPRESLPIYVEKLPDITIRRDYFDEWLASEGVEGEIAVPYLGVELDDGVVLYKVRRMRILFERHRKRKPTPERKAKPTRKRRVAGGRS